MYGPKGSQLITSREKTFWLGQAGQMVMGPLRPQSSFQVQQGEEKWLSHLDGVRGLQHAAKHIDPREETQFRRLGKGMPGIGDFHLLFLGPVGGQELFETLFDSELLPEALHQLVNFFVFHSLSFFGAKYR